MSTENQQGGYGGDQNEGDQQQSGSASGDGPGQEADFYQLVGRALVDPGFRDQLRAGDPTGALRSLGIEPTEDLVKALGQAMGDVDRLSSQFGDIKAAT
jgi:hypothetical protein